MGLVFIEKLIKRRQRVTGWVTRNLKPPNDSRSSARPRGVYWLGFDGDGPESYYLGNLLPAPNCTRTNQKEKQPGGRNDQTWCLKQRDVHFCLYGCQQTQLLIVWQ